MTMIKTKFFGVFRLDQIILISPLMKLNENKDSLFFKVTLITGMSETYHLTDIMGVTSARIDDLKKDYETLTELVGSNVA